MIRLWRTLSRKDEDAVVVLSAIAVVLVVLVVGAIGSSMARDDAGVHQFFASEAAGAGLALRSTNEPTPTAPPLTIRAERAHPVLAQRQPRKMRAEFAKRTGRAPVVAKADTPVWAAAPPIERSPVVSLYEDRTLRRGDAVMTPKGIRVFAGSRTFPFRPEDFRKLASSKQFDLPFRRLLTEIDHLPKQG